MKAIQLLGKEQIQLNELPKPEISEKEVLIKVKAASICGTDVRMYKNGYPTASEETPLTLGHEISGDIVEVELPSGIMKYKVLEIQRNI